MGISDKIKNAKGGTSLFEDISPDRMYALKMQARIAIAIFNERKTLGMSQSQFAEICGVTQAMVSKWESGEYNFSITSWAELSHKLSISFDPIPMTSGVERGEAPPATQTSNVVVFPVSNNVNFSSSVWTQQATEPKEM